MLCQENLLRDDVYVYSHTRVTDSIVFYIGVGVNKRAWVKREHNQHWLATVNKHAYVVTILHSNLTLAEAHAMEIYLIARYRVLSGKNLCNMTIGGEGSFGYRHTPDAKDRIRAAQVGKVRSEEHKAIISQVHKGKCVSDETRKKMQDSANKQSKELRMKLGLARRGCKFSEEALARVRENRKPISEETRAKISATSKGRPRSEETLAKLRESIKKHWAERRKKAENMKVVESYFNS
jgi:hypothetical protein